LAQSPPILTSDDVIEQLISSDHTVSLYGIDGYLKLSSDQRTSEVKSALIQALQNQIELMRQNALSKGDWMPLYRSHNSAERSLSLAKEVLYLRDPSTLPLLIEWGFDDEIIDFGRQAFEHVLNFVESPPPGISTGSQLFTLRMMVDHWGLSSFNTLQQNRMIRVASKYIEEFKFSNIYSAVSLAASLKDISLVQLANNLLNDDAEMAKRGISDREWIQENIDRALSGNPHMRQYVPVERQRWCNNNNIDLDDCLQ